MLTGFPPKSVDLADMDLSIVSAGIKSGDTLIFEIVKKSTPSATPAKSNDKENMVASESKPSSAGSASSSISSAPRANTSSSMSSSS